MAVVLFYTPFIRRAPDVESVMLEMKKRGHTVLFVTQHTGEHIKSYLQAAGISFHSNYIGDKKNFWHYIRQIIFFIRFCHKNKVQIVFSHLDPANFVAAIGQYFVKARVYLCRHHINEAHLYNYHRSFTYKLTNMLAQKIIVVSSQARLHMVNEEKVSPDKILHVNLAYDFSIYKAPSAEAVNSLRRSFDTDLLLVTVSRLTQYKRPYTSIDLLVKIQLAGVDAKLVILGTGPMHEELTEYIRNQNLNDRVILKGHVFDVLQYLAAADFVVHPSLLESSCVVIKEAGLMRKPVVVCKSIGDFDGYMVHGINGFIVSQNRFAAEAASVIIENYKKKELLLHMGNVLYEDVTSNFDIGRIYRQYDSILRSVSQE